MCLIIQRPERVKLDFEKFKVAVENNPDGFGLSATLCDGRLLTIRDHHKPDVETLFKLVDEELIDHKVMLHLRYTTVGDTTLRNAHPFPVLEYKEDGADLRMAHNGTLGSYKGNTGESDSRRFVRNFVRPLFKRMSFGFDSHEILSDPFIERLLDRELSSMSVISFIDGYGNTLNVNEKGNGGFTENGVYYSNKYSFDPGHRNPSAGFYTPNYTMGYSSPKQTPSKPNNTTKVYKHAEDTVMQRFSEKFGLDFETDILLLGNDAIELLVDEHPEDAKLLIAELLDSLERHVKKVVN